MICPKNKILTKLNEKQKTIQILELLDTGFSPN